MLKFLRPFGNWASLVCYEAPVEKGYRNIRFPMNGIDCAYRHRMHWLSRRGQEKGWIHSMKNKITKLDLKELKYDIFFPPKASELAIKARHPKLVQSVSYISDSPPTVFTLPHLYLRHYSFWAWFRLLSVILSFERDFVFWAWFRLFATNSYVKKSDFVFWAWCHLLSMISSFERDFVIYAT